MAQSRGQMIFTGNAGLIITTAKSPGGVERKWNQKF
jgi:hypothetical protein